MIKSLVSQFNESFDVKEKLLPKSVFVSTIESCLELCEKATSQLNDVNSFASKESYFELFRNLDEHSIFKNKNTSNMMWHLIIKEQEEELRNFVRAVNLNAKKEEDMVEYSHDFLFERFQQMDGWQTYDLESNQNNNDVEPLSSIGSLDSIFFSAPVQKETVSNFKIKKQNDDVFVSFKAGECLEHVVFNESEDFFLSHLTLKDDFERINVLKKINKNWFQIFISKNKSFEEVQVFKIDLNGDLVQCSDYNSLFFMNDLNSDITLFRKSKHVIGEITNFNSELFKHNGTDFVKIANSLMIEYINQYGYNLFKRNKTLGYDFHYSYDEDIKNSRTQKVLSNRELTVSDKFWSKDFGIRNNRITSDIFLSNMILLTETNSAELNHFILNEKQELSIPNIDKMFDVSYSNLKDVFLGDEMRLLSLNSLDQLETRVSNEFGKAILKNKRTFFKVIDSHESVDFASIAVNNVEQSFFDNFEIQNPVNDDKILDGYSFFLKDITLFHETNVKFYSPIGFISIFKDQCTKYNNLCVPEFVLKEFKLTPILGHGFAYDKRSFRKTDFIKALEDLGANMTDVQNINYKEFNEFFIKLEHVSDNRFMHFKILVSDKEYFDITNKTENFNNEYLMDFFNNWLNENIEISKEESDNLAYFKPDTEHFNTFMFGIPLDNKDLIDRLIDGLAILNKIELDFKLFEEEK